MIKCNVTIIGRVFRAPEIKNDREGNPLYSVPPRSRTTVRETRSSPSAFPPN